MVIPKIVIARMEKKLQLCVWMCVLGVKERGQVVGVPCWEHENTHAGTEAQKKREKQVFQGQGICPSDHLSETCHP